MTIFHPPSLQACLIEFVDCTLSSYMTLETTQREIEMHPVRFYYGVSSTILPTS